LIKFILFDKVLRVDFVMQRDQQQLVGILTAQNNKELKRKAAVLGFRFLVNY